LRLRNLNERFSGNEKYGKGEILRKITLKAIGRVRNSIRKKNREGWESVISEVIIDPKYEEALEGVEDYSHLFILFWLSRMLTREKEPGLKIHPKSRLDLPLVGVFSTRTQYRPNPIGLTLVKLIKRKKIFSKYGD
jgi:tRNA (adenine37-N6)-methyltransferase